MNIENLVKDIKSWKTTAVGWLTGLTLIIPQLVALLDTDPNTVFDMKLLVAGLAAIGIGTFAKDGDKSTKDVTDGSSR